MSHVTLELSRIEKGIRARDRNVTFLYHETNTVKTGGQELDPSSKYTLQCTGYETRYDGWTTAALQNPIT